jgi:hypothetical protein
MKEEIVYYPESNDYNLEAIRIADGQHLIESKYDKVFNQYSQQGQIFEFVRGKLIKNNFKSLFFNRKHK